MSSNVAKDWNEASRKRKCGDAMFEKKGIYIYIYLQSISFQRDSDHAVIHVTMLLALLQRPILDINAHIFRLLSIVF